VSQTFGLIGKSLAHSFSPDYFSEKFQRERLSGYQYQKFEIPSVADLADFLRNTENIRGLNVTIPYKESVIPYLDKLSPEAESIGAVNVISFENGEKIGHNTDAEGFAMTLKDIKFKGRKAFVLGTGGASKAVSFALQALGFEVEKVSRNPISSSEIDYHNFNNRIIEADIIVNTTPLGTFPKVEECPPIDFSRLHHKQILYDLIYNPAETVFLRQGKAAGCTIINGKQMLINQAELSWKIWQKTTL
jgi:shikimate dehydrogenase